MFADWDCIFRKLRAGGDGRDKPGYDAVGESIISALGIILDDPFFLSGLREWLETGRIEHDTSYLHRIDHGHPVMASPAGQIGRQLANTCCITGRSLAWQTRSAWA